jgi:hypothetical protein
MVHAVTIRVRAQKGSFVAEVKRGALVLAKSRATSREIAIRNACDLARGTVPRIGSRELRAARVAALDDAIDLDVIDGLTA